MSNHYCPKVDLLIVCILSDLRDKTQGHVGLDFNSLKRSHSQRGFSPVIIWPAAACNRLNGFPSRSASGHQAKETEGKSVCEGKRSVPKRGSRRVNDAQ